MASDKLKKNRLILIAIMAILLLAVAYACCQWQLGSAKKTYAVDPLSKMIVEANASPLSFLFSRKVVLLSFDDGPRNVEVDHAILGILKKHAAQSIWMVNCRNLDPGITPDAATNRNTLSEISQAGHLIGNHGYRHLNLKDLERDHPEQLRDEIAGCSDYLQALRGERPKYFRPPWGQFTPASARIIQDAGMTNLLWTQTTIDTLSKDSPEMQKTMVKYWNELNVENGDVILFHDTALTARNLDSLLTRLDNEGFIYVVPN
jgi:peptidoglycan/xylan/chitin deacetylase (PgdA/CDA1 family)